MLESVDIYLMYRLVLGMGVTPNKIYNMCKNRYNANEIPYCVWPYEPVQSSQPSPQNNMNRWIFKTLSYIGTYDYQYDAHDLTNFIAKYATENVNLTLWDRIKKWFQII